MKRTILGTVVIGLLCFMSTQVRAAEMMTEAEAYAIGTEVGHTARCAVIAMLVSGMTAEPELKQMLETQSLVMRQHALVLLREYPGMTIDAANLGLQKLLAQAINVVSDQWEKGEIGNQQLLYCDALYEGL